MRKVNLWHRIAVLYATSNKVEKANDILGELNRLLDQVGVPKQTPTRQISGRNSKSLILLSDCSLTPPKGIMSSKSFGLANLATEDDLHDLSIRYECYFASIDDENTPVVADFQPSLDRIEVRDNSGDIGMDIEAGMSPEELSAQLGLGMTGLPFQFNEKRHIGGENEWDSPESFGNTTDLIPQ
jgi:hypothetical protein